MIGRTLAHYQIAEAIGAGGMGQVFRATDTKLGRDVALKVLPPDMARDPERLARFQREARAVAALNHPHIVTIFSVEEAEGVHFLTMELVEGQSLDRRIPSGGLATEQIMTIAAALADALSAAHEKGIVHRDLKPGNVMVTGEGRVKVLDFGLAKDVRAESASNVTLTSVQTQVGVVMGTPAYMSPEQISGRALDHRTDIFSLGVVLHEMCTGRRPFEGLSSAELTSAILRDDPPSVADSRSDLPSDLARIINRCLEKDPRHRVQTARDVSNEFRSMARSATHSPPTPSQPRPATPAARDSGEARAAEGFWVAVLPFKGASGDAELEALADGLTEDVTNGLSRFPYLQVIANNSAMAQKGRAADIRAVGRELRARYVLEGSVRKRGRAVRVSAQLMDAVSGTQLWAESYDRELSDSGTFEIQDDLTDHIVAAVADGYGVLVRSMAGPTRDRKVEELSASELVLRDYAFMQQVNPQEHGELRAGFERALEREPNHADAWACLSNLYQLEYFNRLNPLPNPLDRARDAAWRAVKIDPASQMGWRQLAAVQFFSRDFMAFRDAAERAMSLNPRDGTTWAYMAIMIGYSGDWERGVALAKRIIDLNRHHPGWYHNIFFSYHYRKDEYEAALIAAKKINMPEYHWMHLFTAAASAMLGRDEEARTAIESLRKYSPTFLDLKNVREDIEIWDPDKADVERFMLGLQKAGLQYGSADSAARADAALPSSSPIDKSSRALHVGEGFSVAVLPFKYTDSNADLTALAEGLTEDILTGMSRFPYLRVIAKDSTARYAHESGEVRVIGKELGAGYVIAGNVRLAGTKLRVGVQLVDTTAGAQLWAETYEHSFSPESVFEIQDELVPRIVSTIADAHGILTHTLSEEIRSKSSDQLSPYEAVLRSFSYSERVTPEEHAAARAALERAVQQSPGYGYAWAMLSIIYADEYALGFNTLADPLGRALEAARKAVDADRSNHRCFHALAYVQFHRREIQAFRTATERAIGLNPMDGCTIAQLGSLTAQLGEWERGCAMVEKALRLNPHHPGWYWFTLVHNAYRKGDYREALSIATRINVPGLPATHLVFAAAYGQLGELDSAAQAVRELLTLLPNAGAIVRLMLGIWVPPELVEQYVVGLRKAGLEIAAAPTASVPAPKSDPSTAVK